MRPFRPQCRPQRLALHVSQALTLIGLSQGTAWADDAIASPQAVVVTGKAPETPAATQSAPSQGSLAARSALSIVDDSYIRNFTLPTADYTQIVAATPGAFSYSPNGVGLGDTKITLRGLSDSFMNYTFDGIPFNDTNGVSHHSWAYFPSQFLGGVVVDRGPGTAASVGQATFGGSVLLQSRLLDGQKRSSFSSSLGTWNTQILSVEHETGDIGSEGKSNLLVNMQSLGSDGYQTYNKQERQTLSAKFQTALTDHTTLTLFGSYLGLQNNTPNIKGVTRANVEAGNYTALLSADPKQANYYGYNFYNLFTNFGYAGIATEVDGWKIDDKLYRYQYHNQQNYNGSKISATSAIDKLNAYITTGNLFKASREFSLGTLRTGLWLDRAESRRYQIPSDPRTWVDQALPNFYETYTTTTVQPYVEFEFKLSPDLLLTPGLKAASYKQDFVHRLDNSNFAAKYLGSATTLANAISYTDVLPTLDLHYKVQPNWSAYVQAAVGDEIPSTSVFDVPAAKVSPVPKATKAKTVQFGTVWNSDVMSLAADIYHSQLDGAYTPLAPDAAGNVGYVLSGTQTNQGVEVEGNFRLGSGFSAYASATMGSYKYANGQWVAGAPKDTQTLGLNYEHGRVDVNLSANRVGQMYSDAKDGTHQAFTIDPVTVLNLTANYSLKSPESQMKQMKLQVGVNNLLNSHAITSIASPVGSTPNAADLLNVLPARSVILSATLDF
jgi:iron complex outermembrane receptor protein